MIAGTNQTENGNWHRFLVVDNNKNSKVYAARNLLPTADDHSTPARIKLALRLVCNLLRSMIKERTVSECCCVDYVFQWDAG